MRTQTNPVEVFAGRVAQVRDWRRSKKVKMDCKGIRRCAKELGLSSAMVKDALNVLARKAVQ